jgi:iron complex outermembrane receptor protein
MRDRSARRRTLGRTLPLALTAALCGTIPVRSQQSAEELRNLSVASLMDREVTSASKKTESLSGAPAAIFVITGEEIRRGGFSSVPDALRMVPGLHVAQQSAKTWLVAARGFTQTFNNKMLVLIDGRLVYSPSFGGVYWDVQDPPLSDIDRIEVIRGPGGTLWGANAVNGVINIVTKEAGKTLGESASTSAGVNEGYAAGVRFGANLGEKLAYRIYGTTNDWLPSVTATGADNFDTWSISQGGTRLDWNASPKDTVTFDGQGYSGREREPVPILSVTSPPMQTNSAYVVKGGHVLSRWKHALSERSAMDVLGYCDWTVRSGVASDDDSAICDVELQHSYSFTNRHSLIWGGSVMSIGETKARSFTIEHVPATRRDMTYSSFLQYEFVLVPDKFRVIAGSKFEHNDYSGFEVQPQIRAVWTPKKTHALWAAVSRAVRTPTRVENGLEYRFAELSQAPPTFLLFSGNPNLHSESLRAYELGYRYEWKQVLSVDLALYYNGYDSFVGPGASGAPVFHSNPFFIDVPLHFASVGNGQTHGLEFYMKYAPIPRWTLSIGATELRGNSPAGLNISAATNDPRHQANLQSRFDLTRHFNFDAAYYYYDVIPHQLPPLNRVDLGASTKPLHGFTFSVWGRNLQTNRHQEALASFAPAGEIRRSIVFNWRGNRSRTEARISVETKSTEPRCANSSPGDRYSPKA